VRLHSLCFSVSGSLSVSALSTNSADVLKALLRTECPELLQVPNSQIRLLYRGVELTDENPITHHWTPASDERQLDLHFLVIGPGAAEGFQLALCDVPCPAELERRLQECAHGLNTGVLPILSENGSGGTYFLKHAAGHTLAVFKPKDEEAGAPQNPRGYAGKENTRRWQTAVASAHRAVREVAAFLLDTGHGALDGHAGVPMTTLARCRHQAFVPVHINGDSHVVWKVGAFQAFVENAELSEDFGRSVHAIQDVHKIGILDLRIVNFDRNLSNMLVQGRGKKLIPIDHGCSFPDRLDFMLSEVAWSSWPQSKEPFSSDELAYIAQLDGEADARKLSATLGLERHCLRLMEVSTRWLQVAASHGCTLHQIAAALYRADASPERPSKVEGIMRNCIASAFAATSTADKGKPLGRTVSLRDPTPLSETADGCIFNRILNTGKELQWTQPLEENFRRHVGEELNRLVKAMKPDPGFQVGKYGLAAAPEQSDESEEDEIPLARSSGAYVPPHARRVKSP
ncbi:PI4KG3, partial [Symbiodinium pilosum]